MQQQGVVFDVVGYHAYPRVTQLLLSEDPWYGVGGALTQLAKFNKPVRINEFNCGEIYAVDYQNLAGAPATTACLASIQKHLKSLMAQKVVQLESIHAYEITDRPLQAPPENRFGLMVDLDTPKLHLALFSAFAGGHVSPVEWKQLNALGLIGPGPIIGVNIHAGGGNVVNNQKLADVMGSRNLKTARMDFTPDSDLANFRDQVLRLKEKGVKAETSLQTSYRWSHECSQNLAAVEADAYGQTVLMVQRIMDLVQDFELLNDVSLRSETAAQVPPYLGTPASGYVGKPCYDTLAAVLRGMSKAIVDQRTTSGLPLRIILGGVSNDFGFLDFMQQQGVVFDIVGYRAFPWLTHALLTEDPWYGAGGALAQLASFGKPVRISAFNCGEIFAPSYDNTAAGGQTVTCLASIQKHLKNLVTQSLVHLESIHAYEITDRPSQSIPGNRFGLMFDLDNPKLHLALFSIFSGGYVSVIERLQLDLLGLTGP